VDYGTKILNIKEQFARVFVKTVLADTKQCRFNRSATPTAPITASQREQFQHFDAVDELPSVWFVLLHESPFNAVQG
jgi:hypothetical protein